MRSVVAPVRALMGLMGLMVSLPRSLNQMHFWMQSVPSTSMPPRGKRVGQGLQSLAEPAPDGTRPVNACFHG